jgi:hypothetical protein
VPTPTCVDRLLVPQATEVNEPQLPENTCITAPELFNSVPIPLNATAKSELDEAEVILYHTSSSGVPVAQPVGMLPLALAFQTVPELLVTPVESVTAPEQSSFDGGEEKVTVILKAEPGEVLPIDPVPDEYILT